MGQDQSQWDRIRPNGTKVYMVILFLLPQTYLENILKIYLVKNIKLYVFSIDIDINVTVL